MTFMEDKIYIKFLENLKEEMNKEMDPIVTPLFFQIDDMIKHFKTGGLDNTGSYTIIAKDNKIRYTATITLEDAGYNLTTTIPIVDKIKSIVFKTERVTTEKS